MTDYEGVKNMMRKHNGGTLSPPKENKSVMGRILGGMKRNMAQRGARVTVTPPNKSYVIRNAPRPKPPLPNLKPVAVRPKKENVNAAFCPPKKRSGNAQGVEAMTVKQMMEFFLNKAPSNISRKFMMEKGSKTPTRELLCKFLRMFPEGQKLFPKVNSPKVNSPKLPNSNSPSALFNFLNSQKTPKAPKGPSRSKTPNFLMNGGNAFVTENMIMGLSNFNAEAEKTKKYNYEAGTLATFPLKGSRRPRGAAMKLSSPSKRTKLLNFGKVQNMRRPTRSTGTILTEVMPIANRVRQLEANLNRLKRNGANKASINAANDAVRNAKIRMATKVLKNLSKSPEPRKPRISAANRPLTQKQQSRLSRLFKGRI